MPNIAYACKLKLSSIQFLYTYFYIRFFYESVLAQNLELWFKSTYIPLFMYGKYYFMGFQQLIDKHLKI